MPIQFKDQPGTKVLRVTVTGKLTKEDYEAFAPAVDRMIEAPGKARILFEMHDFHGWEMGALWQDIKFDAKHFRDLERIAMVGETKWQKWMSEFCKPFTTAEVRYFDESQLTQAQAWVSGTNNQP